MQLDNGQYQTRLLWRNEDRPDNNYHAARKAFYQYENRLQQDARAQESYHLAMKKLINCEFLEPVRNTPDDPQHFLTGFMVLKDGQPLEKGRFVVNGSRKFKGESLNDFLEPGANVINDISEVLLRLRTRQYVVCCDLQDMFLNMKVDPRDRPYLRLFYREGPGQELRVYQFTVHAFGLASSPCVAITCVKLHAKHHASQWPLAEAAIRCTSMVDDIWFTSDSLSELRLSIIQVQELMRSMHIEVHKWGSNWPPLLEGIPAEKRAKVITLKDPDREVIKALGLVWDAEKDVFLFPQGPPDLQPWTLRSMTSSAAKLFDPLGLISPTTLPAKLLIQHAWRYQDGWDDSVPEELGKKMSLYCRNQTQLQQVASPRHLGGHEGQGRLVIFTDASSMAQAAAGYWVSNKAGLLDSNLVASKVKVTGLRQHESIGRLELVAAVMGVILAVRIAKALELDMAQVLYFTDSMSVLYWLSTTRALTPYAGHRVAQILERSTFHQWKYVNTAQNPSDIPTRGMRAKDLASCELWWKGPAYLRSPAEEWPEQPHIRADEQAAAETRSAEELCQQIVLKTVHSEASGRLGLLLELRPLVGTVRKAIRALRKLADLLYTRFKKEQFIGSFHEWEAVWVKYEQQQQFPQLYAALIRSERPSELLELDPRLDCRGVIRVNMGISHSHHHDWETHYPILLKGDMIYCKEYFREAHCKALAHLGGIGTLLNQVRKRFHVIGGRKVATSVIQDCFRCAKKSWRPLQIPTPEFHATRMGNSGLRAFQEIGIDHMGPFLLRQNRGTVQGFVLVIACCATRAVNLEMSLSTGSEHVLAALQRHIGVYGPPMHINSDGGPGFVKARRIIQANTTALSGEGWLNLEAPEWNINVPYSPTWSAHVESMVKITKMALQKLHTGPTMSKLTPDEFNTQLKRCQGFINMRPLISSEPGRPPLTPGDFIGTGCAWLTSVVYAPEDRGSLGLRYKQMEKLREEIWNTFRQDYLCWLRRQSTGRSQQLPEVDDLVLVKDVPAWKGDGWPVARVVTIKGEPANPRVYELEIVPTEELRKEAQLINRKHRLKLDKKIILRNYRQLGLLPKINSFKEE